MLKKKSTVLGRKLRTWLTPFFKYVFYLFAGHNRYELVPELRLSLPYRVLGPFTCALIHTRTRSRLVAGAQNQAFCLSALQIEHPITCTYVRLLGFAFTWFQ